MKKTGLTLLKVVFSVGILVYIFTRVVHIQDLWANLREASVSYLVAAVALYFLVQTISAYRWYLLLRPLEIETSFLKLLGLYYLGMYFNFFLPSAIGGDVVKVYYLHKETGRLSASTASVFLDRDIGMGGLLLAATAVSAYGGTRFEGWLLAPLFALIGVAFVAANLALFYRPSYNVLHRILSLFKMKKADEKVERLYDSFNSYRGKWSLVVVTLVLSLAIQAGCAFVNMLAAGAIGLHTQNGWIDYLVFIPAIGLIGMMPLSVNGAGWREWSYIVFFPIVAVGVDAQHPVDAQHAKDLAATLSLLWLGIIVITSLPGGIVYIARGGRPKKSEAAYEIDLEKVSVVSAITPSPEKGPLSTI